MRRLALALALLTAPAQASEAQVMIRCGGFFAGASAYLQVAVNEGDAIAAAARDAAVLKYSLIRQVAERRDPELGKVVAEVARREGEALTALADGKDGAAWKARIDGLLRRSDGCEALVARLRAEGAE